MQPELIITPFGESADPATVRDIPQSNPSGAPRQNASWEQGFPLITMTPIAAGGIPPEGPDMNGVLRAISRHASFVGGGGQYKWSAEYVAAKGGYPKGAVIQADNGEVSYVSTEDGNSTNFNAYPDSIGKQWVFFGGATSYFELQFEQEQEKRENEFNQFLINTAFEMPPIPFVEGSILEISRPTQLVSHEGQLYSVRMPASFPVVLSDIWDVAVSSLTPRSDEALRQQLSTLNYGAAIVYKASPQVFGFDKLKSTIPRYQGDRVDVVSHTFPFPAPGPLGAMAFVWDSSSTATETPGTVSAVDGLSVGRWLFQGLEYRDVDFGVTGEGDESAVMQSLLDSVPSGATILITKKVKCNDLVCNANSIYIDSRSSAYFESPGLVAFAPSAKPLLTIGGYGWKVGSLWVEDGTVEAGVINTGSQGVVLKRADGKKDLDAYIYGLNVFKFDVGLRKVGINCRTLGGGNIFSHCLNSIVVDQVTETVSGVPTLQDVRGIIVAGGARFHGRPTSRITDGVSSPVAGTDGCDIIINGTVQRENMVQCNLADGSGGFFRGQLGRGCLLSDNVVRTPGGDAVVVIGGISGAIDGLTIAGGEANGLVFNGGSDIPVNGLNIDTVFEHGVVLRNTLGVMLSDFKIQNVSAKPGSATSFVGILVDASAVLTKIGSGRLKQSVATTGDVGIDNQGNQTYLSAFCDVLGFLNGKIRQSLTQRLYGDDGLMSNRTLRKYLTAPPTEGTFGAGDRVVNTNPTIANPITVWIRTADGAWRVEDFITYSGSTSLRPILQTNWGGVMYFDTTIGGKPIWWNGSAWKDATGATV